MRGVILAGGTGTRLFPLTKYINKHLLPVGRLPMILHSVMKLKEAAVEDILVVTGKQSAGLYSELLGSGMEWNVNITFRIQEDAGGIAQALLAAEGFIQPHEKFIVILGDNLFEDSLHAAIKEFMLQEQGARVLLKETADLRMYGVPIIRNNEIIFIEEKPTLISNRVQSSLPLCFNVVLLIFKMNPKIMCDNGEINGFTTHCM